VVDDVSGERVVDHEGERVVDHEAEIHIALARQ
jgi:hypothetical protein